MEIYARENQISISAPAKINLFLELIAKRDDGFHEIETVMSSVSVFDRLNFSLRSDSDTSLEIQLTQRGNQPGEADSIPTDDSNLICKAINLVRTRAQADLGNDVCRHGFDVILQKNIPSAAGLGGASSDAAASLIAANYLWRLNWSMERLMELAAELGSDIAFFLVGGTAVCRGRGENVESVSMPAGMSVVIAKPPVALSTAKVFSQVKLDGEVRDSAGLLSGLKNHTSCRLGDRMFNRLQQFVEPMTDQIKTIAKEFASTNCLGHQMSGSGSSYFGVFSNARLARLATKRLSARMPNARIFCSRTLRTRGEFVNLKG